MGRNSGRNDCFDDGRRLELNTRASLNLPLQRRKSLEETANLLVAKIRLYLKDLPLVRFDLVTEILWYLNGELYIAISFANFSRGGQENMLDV